MATEKQDPKLSSIREGYCPQCSTSLNFSEEDRIDGAEIVCPKCSRKFNIEESQKSQSQTPKKKSGLTGGAAALLMFVILGIVGYAIFSSDWYQEGIPDVPEKAKPQYEVGQALSGISMEEISSKWVEENDKSSVKADEYIEGLKGTSIVWIGEVEDVSNYQVYYLFSDTENRKIMKIKVNDSIFDHFAYIDVTGKQEYIDLNRGTLVKITGKIAGFNTKGTELMLSPEIEGATLEVVK